MVIDKRSIRRSVASSSAIERNETTEELEKKLEYREEDTQIEESEVSEWTGASSSDQPFPTWC